MPILPKIPEGATDMLQGGTTCMKKKSEYFAKYCDYRPPNAPKGLKIKQVFANFEKQPIGGKNQAQYKADIAMKRSMARLAYDESMYRAAQNAIPTCFVRSAPAPNQTQRIFSAEPSKYSTTFRPAIVRNQYAVGPQSHPDPHMCREQEYMSSSRFPQTPAPQSWQMTGQYTIPTVCNRQMEPTPQFVPRPPCSPKPAYTRPFIPAPYPTSCCHHSEPEVPQLPITVCPPQSPTTPWQPQRPMSAWRPPPSSTAWQPPPPTAAWETQQPQPNPAAWQPQPTNAAWQPQPTNAAWQPQPTSAAWQPQQSAADYQRAIQQRPMMVPHPPLNPRPEFPRSTYGPQRIYRPCEMLIPQTGEITHLRSFCADKRPPSASPMTVNMPINFSYTPSRNNCFS